MALTTRLPSTRVEPFYGFVESTGDALRLIQAARQGLVPRITRRLNDLERRAMIRSGAIFIFSDEEGGIKRWTEGLSWSASRIVGNFLVYREVSDRADAHTPPKIRRSAKRRGSSQELSPEEIAEQKLAKSLVGCLSDTNGRFKPNGLVKKTITICVEGSDHHLIAYYNQEDVKLGKLLPLTSRPDITALGIPPELLESTKFRIPPIMEEGDDGRPRYICDAEEGELPRPTNITLHSIPEMSMPKQIIPHYDPGAQNIMFYADGTATAPSAQSKIPHTYQPLILSRMGPSMSSSAFDTLEWLGRTSYVVHPTSQVHQCPGVNQPPERFGIPASPGFTPQSFAPSGSPATSMLWPACNGDLGTNLDATPSYNPASRSSYSSISSYIGHMELPLSTWITPHHGQHLSCSSMPCTTTQARQSHGLAALSSTLDNQISNALSQ